MKNKLTKKLKKYTNIGLLADKLGVGKNELAVIVENFFINGEDYHRYANTIYLINARKVPKKLRKIYKILGDKK